MYTPPRAKKAKRATVNLERSRREDFWGERGACRATFPFRKKRLVEKISEGVRESGVGSAVTTRSERGNGPPRVRICPRGVLKRVGENPGNFASPSLANGRCRSGRSGREGGGDKKFSGRFFSVRWKTNE